MSDRRHSRRCFVQSPLQGCTLVATMASQVLIHALICDVVRIILCLIGCCRIPWCWSISILTVPQDPPLTELSVDDVSGPRHSILLSSDLLTHVFNQNNCTMLKPVGVYKCMKMIIISLKRNVK